MTNPVVEAESPTRAKRGRPAAGEETPTRRAQRVLLVTLDAMGGLWLSWPAARALVADAAGYTGPTRGEVADIAINDLWKRSMIHMSEPYHLKDRHIWRDDWQRRYRPTAQG